MKRILLGMLALTLLTVTACKKKDKEPSNITPTTANLAGSYKLSKITMKPSGGTETDVTNSWLQACEKDDVITLNAAGTWVLTDAGTQCSPASSDNGTWSLPSTTTFNMDGDIYTIDRWNGTNFDISISDPTFGTIKQYLIRQ